MLLSWIICSRFISHSLLIFSTRYLGTGQFYFLHYLNGGMCTWAIILLRLKYRPEPILRACDLYIQENYLIVSFFFHCEVYVFIEFIWFSNFCPSSQSIPSIYYSLSVIIADTYQGLESTFTEDDDTYPSNENRVNIVKIPQHRNREQFLLTSFRVFSVL